MRVGLAEPNYLYHVNSIFKLECDAVSLAVQRSYSVRIGSVVTDLQKLASRYAPIELNRDRYICFVNVSLS